MARMLLVLLSIAGISQGGLRTGGGDITLHTAPHHGLESSHELMPLGGVNLHLPREIDGDQWRGIGEVGKEEAIATVCLRDEDSLTQGVVPLHPNLGEIVSQGLVEDAVLLKMKPPRKGDDAQPVRTGFEEEDVKLLIVLVELVGEEEEVKISGRELVGVVTDILAMSLWRVAMKIWKFYNCEKRLSYPC